MLIICIFARKIVFRMVEKISITNYLSIKEKMDFSFVSSREKEKLDGKTTWYEQCGDRKLAKLLFILGNNAAGKTNFINAVRTLRTLVVAKPTERDEALEYMPFMLDNDSRFKPTTFDVVFFTDDTRYLYSITYDETIIRNESLKISRRTRDVPIYIRTYDEERDLSKVDFYPECGLAMSDQVDLQRQTTTNTSVLSSFWAMNLNSKSLSSSYLFFRDKIGLNISQEENLADILSKGTKIEQKRLKNDVLMFLSIIKSNISDYKITEHRWRAPRTVRQNRLDMAEDGSEMFVMDERVFRTITFYHQTENGEYPLDENLESDGTLALIRLIAMTQTLINRGMTIFLDEQPAGIHEQALQYLISCYLRLSTDCQLIVAGQDTSFLSYKKLRRDSIRIFKKDDDGNTYLFKDADNRLFMSNTNVRNFVQNNLDIFRIEDDTNIDDLFEQLRIMYLRRKGKKE